MKTRNSWIVAIVAVIALAVVAGAVMARWPNVDRAAADGIALRELEDYAARERLVLRNFSHAEVTEHTGPWWYVYNYSGEPKQHVVVSVYRDGRAELSRMFDDASR